MEYAASSEQVVAIRILCSVAVQNGCGLIWGEATQNSCDYYEKVFDLEPVRDLLYIPHEKFARFAASLQAKWKQSKA